MPLLLIPPTMTESQNKLGCNLGSENLVQPETLHLLMNYTMALSASPVFF